MSAFAPLSEFSFEAMQETTEWWDTLWQSSFVGVTAGDSSMTMIYFLNISKIILCFVFPFWLFALANSCGLLGGGSFSDRTPELARMFLASFLVIVMTGNDGAFIGNVAMESRNVIQRYTWDALWNNSGILTSKRVQSAQGHESNYAVHVLAPYLLIEGLRPALARPNGARSIIVNTTSSAQNAAKALDVETLSNPPEIGGLTGAYATSKLALTTLGSALAEELERDGTLLRSICPGPVITPMTKTSDGMPWLLRPLVPFLFAKPEKQAAKMIRAAQPDALGGRTGIYISNGKEKSVPKLASDPEIQRRLLEKLAQDAA